MKKIVITGAAGFLGWHLCCRLKSMAGMEPILVDRESFARHEQLDAALREADVVVHFAGVNRASAEDIMKINVGLAETLVAALRRAGHKPHLLYSSTTHIERDTPYGKSKREAGRILQQWAETVDAPYTNLIIPHVFGEQCKPFYNSAAATFCYQVANRETPKVENNSQLELLHAQDVAAAIISAIDKGSVGDIRLKGHPITVTEMLDRIRALDASYRSDIIPDVRDRFTLQLFNAYRGYLFPNHYPVGLTLHTDERGSLFEAVKGMNGGQSFLSTTKPDITRGNHFHFEKIERFLVVEGEAVIRIRKLFDSQVYEFRVNGDSPQYIDMPTLHTHNITNVGRGNLLTLFWSHQIFDPARPDTIRELV